MYKLPQLEYDYQSLGTHISADIMRLHHSKHHQTYVDKLNTALESVPNKSKSTDINQLISQLDDLPESVRTAVRNNGGGHYNHSLFWKWLSPQGGGEPTGDLADSITAKFGDFQSFVDAFTSQALDVFGSGWCWLLPDMEIITTPNQDSPLMLGLKEPVLGLDVWEHAYYLDYRNKRDDYVAAWWNVVNWQVAEQRYDSLK